MLMPKRNGFIAPALGELTDEGWSDEKGPAARRRPKAAWCHFLCVERAAEGANAADGPLSSLYSVVNGSTQTVSPAVTSPRSSSRRMKQLAHVMEVRMPEP